MSLVVANHLTIGGNGSSVSSHNTASIAPGKNRLVLLAIQTSTYVPTSVTGAGMTWEIVGQSGSYGGHIMTLFRSMSASPSSGALTINLNGNSNCVWAIDEFDNVDTTGANGVNAIVQVVAGGDANESPSSPLTMTLATFKNANNATYGAIYMNTSSPSLVEGSGFSNLGSFTTGSESIRNEWQSQSDPTVDFTWTTAAGRCCGIAVEIKAFIPSGAIFGMM